MTVQFAPAKRSAVKARIALPGPSGAGKAQPLNARILTPTGWTTMGALTVGDRVTSADGGGTTVTGIYPQGVQPVYRVTFNDGASTECTADHLWLTTTYLDRQAKRPGTVKPLRDIMGDLRDRHGKRQHAVPLVQPVEFDVSDVLPIDPYLLGVLLGDGHFGDRFVRLCNSEQQIRDMVSELLPAGVHLRPLPGSAVDVAITRDATTGSNPLVTELRALGLTGVKSPAKFIPRTYLFGSAKTRHALMQGLLDTDGYAKGSNLEYSTSSAALCDDVRFLVESLGGLTTVGTRVPEYVHNGERRAGALSHRMRLRLPAGLAPFRLDRKRDAYRPRSKYQPTRFIERVEPVGEAPVQCISVAAADRLYVTDHCVVTHNTYTGLMLACTLGKKVAVIDTERGRASMYVGLNGWEFDTLNPQSFSPASLTEALGVAAGAGYDALLVDSLSHYWSGVDGMQEQADKRAKGGNSFSGWKEARPDERRMFDALASYPGHVIVTLRTKTSYVIEQIERNGRTTSVPRKVGLKPDQREGIEFEFDLIGDMDPDHTMSVSKTRLPVLSGAVIERPGPELAEVIRDWLADGEDVPGPLAYRAEALDPDATYQGLRDLHTKVSDLGLLNAPVTDGDGNPTVLGQLIVARGNALKPVQVAS